MPTGIAANSEEKRFQEKNSIPRPMPNQTRPGFNLVPGRWN